MTDIGLLFRGINIIILYPLWSQQIQHSETTVQVTTDTVWAHLGDRPIPLLHDSLHLLSSNVILPLPCQAHPLDQDRPELLNILNRFSNTDTLKELIHILETKNRKETKLIINMSYNKNLRNYKLYANSEDMLSVCLPGQNYPGSDPPTWKHENLKTVYHFIFKQKPTIQCFSWSDDTCTVMLCRWCPANKTAT